MLSWGGGVIFFIFSLVFINTAWVTEDAFITFRVVDNALNGYGLTWNPGERVQVYTHPLWFFLLLAGSALHKDPYIVSLALSYFCLAGTLFIALRTLRPCGALSFFILLALLFSKAFVDWMSSGLENPMGYLLAALFLWAWFRKEGHQYHLLFLMLIASAMHLNRPDSVVLIFPALLYAFITDKNTWRKRTGLALMGGVPVLAWVMFSLVYYGAPVPNTALAKTATGIPISAYFMQAGYYILHALRTDIVTVVLLLTGCITGFLQSSRRWQALSAGLMLWIVYLFMIGGDYMAGRFLSTPLLFATLLCAQAVREYPFRKYGLVAVIGMAVAVPQLQYTVLSSTDYNVTGRYYKITDSRGAYYKASGLRNVLKKGFQHKWFDAGMEIGASDKPGIYTGYALGMLPYAAGSDFYWIDPYALSNAFLARLPARAGSRVGHYERAFPAGYLESLITRKNHIVDPALASLYDDVLLASTGDIFRWERFIAILRLNTGFHKNAAANIPVATKEMYPTLVLKKKRKLSWRINEGEGGTAVSFPPSHRSR